MVSEERKKQLLEMVGMTPVRSRASIRHAWVHIEKARRLIGVDNEMAAFRAITAEEEAATGIIIALKDIRYAHSELLKPKDHKHKSGLWSLFQIVNSICKCNSEGRNERRAAVASVLFVPARMRSTHETLHTARPRATIPNSRAFESRPQPV